MKLLNNKYLYLLLLWSMCGIFVSCGNDPIDYKAALEPLADSGPLLTFGTNNTKIVQLEEGVSTSSAITVYREKADAAASYPIVVLENGDNIFTVPQTVDFEAGANEAKITVSYNNAEYDKSYTLKLGFNESDMDPFSQGANYVLQIKQVWTKIGQGQWVDEVYWFWTEVAIEKRVDAPVFRIKSPYTKDILKDYMGYWSDYGYDYGTHTEYLEFTLTEDGYVTWDTPILLNLSYSGDDCKGYYPSKLSSSYAQYDSYSYATFNTDGEISYLTIVPYWYFDKTKTDWGTSYYWLYLGFPGVDISSFLE